MKKRFEFIRALLLGAGPSPELLAAFALGLLVVGIAANLAYDLLTLPVDSLPVAWRPALGVLLFTGLAYLFYWRDRRVRRTAGVSFDESRLAPSHAGLIWLFGPGPFEHLLFALAHHRKEGGGLHCWLLMQDVVPVREAYQHLSQRLIEDGVVTRLHPFYVDRLDVRTSYQAVRAVLEREAGEEELRPGQVIADITGGTKPMSAGTVLAALTSGRALEYVESDRDADGAPVPGSMRVVLLDTAFYIAREG